MAGSRFFYFLLLNQLLYKLPTYLSFIIFDATTYLSTPLTASKVSFILLARRYLDAFFTRNSPDLPFLTSRAEAFLITDLKIMDVKVRIESIEQTHYSEQISGLCNYKAVTELTN